MSRSRGVSEASRDGRGTYSAGLAANASISLRVTEGASNASPAAAIRTAAILRAEFTSVRLVATYDNGLGLNVPEQGVQVYVGTGRRTSWAAAWPAFRHYD